MSTTTTQAGTGRVTWGLWRLLRARSAGRSDPQRLSGALAVLAFAVATALLLVVLGGFNAFLSRAREPGSTPDDGFYVLLAGVASMLLLVPLTTLGGAAARLAMARRDERLAALRLAGATTGQVSALTLLDALTQALVGAVLGVAGTFALIFAVLPVTFQDRPFTYAELVAPWWVFAATVAGVAAVALISAAASLRKVAITPLGVAARHTPHPLHWTRLVPLGLFVAVFAVLNASGRADIAVLALMVAGGLAMLNVLGPWVVSLIGGLTARWARTAPTLLASRRIIDDPKGTWRSVGGVALCTFIAGLAAAIAMFNPASATDPSEEVLMSDMATGGFLTLAVAGLSAAVSTAVMGAGGIIDQRGQYRALHLAGTDMRVLHTARGRQILIPLLTAVGLATAAAILFMLPALGASVLTSLPVLVQYLGSVLLACALVLAGNLASARLVRTVVA